MKISKTKFEILLAQKGLTQNDLAQKSGIPYQNVSTVKNCGTCAPQTAAKLAAGLGVDVSEIVESEG